ncbi:cell wall-binding repeat-containing protein [Peptostreptococcus sp.]|uniref:cell wall-binding repeat-containing protein n=1 Tax=Peptostreptococcus sp. TaxID=1262 RepID=UPI001CAD062E|nr:cell wall-binding repeat-containing protein [Peptostreptococcus sp.]MBF1049223.1 GA module-containing protein [Peptostreptococcus sp.]
MLKKISSILLATTMLFTAIGYINVRAEANDDVIDYIAPNEAYSNFADKSFFYKVRYNSVFNGRNLGTYIAWYANLEDYGIPGVKKGLFDEENPDRIVHEEKDEDTGVVEQTYKSMINADAQDEQNRDFMNISAYNLNSLDYGLYNKITKKFVSKKNTPIKFMPERELSDVAYPEIADGQSKTVRLVCKDKYWMAKLSREGDKYKIKVYLTTSEKGKTEEFKYSYKIANKEIIKEDAQEKTVEHYDYYGEKIIYKLKEAEIQLDRLTQYINIDLNKENYSNTNHNGTFKMEVMIDPSFDSDFTSDTIGLKKLEITGYPFGYSKKIEDLFTEQIFDNSDGSENEFSFRKNGGYNVEDEYRYTIDGSEPTINSKELYYSGDAYNKDGQGMPTYKLSINESKNGVGREGISNQYLDGGKLTIKVRSFRDGQPSSKVFTYDLKVSKRSIDVASDLKVVKIKFNGQSKSFDLANIGINAYVFDNTGIAPLYYDTRAEINKIDIDNTIKEKLKNKKIGRYYPLSISLLDKDGKTADIPNGWKNEQLESHTKGKPLLALSLLKLDENEVEPLKLNNNLKLYEIKDDGSIQEVIDDYNAGLFKYGLKVVSGKLNAKIPIDKPVSKYIMAEENSYTEPVVEDLNELKTNTNKEIDKLSNLSNEEKTKYKNRVNSATTKAEVEKILKEAKEANDKEANKAEVYSVPVRMLQAHSDTASMGEKALDGNVIVRKKDNKYSYEVSFKGLEFMNMYGHLWGLNIYDSSFTSSKSEARVLKKFMDKNLKGKQMEFPKVYAFDKNSKEDTIHIEVYVDAMDAIKNNAQSYEDIVKGAGRQNARLVLDWSKAKKVEDNQGNDSNEVVKRLAGDDRYETAIKISKDNFKSADTVVLASGTNSADALAASSLATSKSAPILLTKRNEIGKNVFDEIKRLNANNVIVVGGKVSISEKVVSDLKNKNITVKRLAGDNRYETSYEIAKELLKSNKAKEAIIVNGFKNVDALSVSSLATKENLPILLNDGNRLSKDIKNIVGDSNIKKMYIIGGRTSLPRRIEDNIKALDIEYERLAGEDRYETSSKIAKYAYENSGKVILASGENSIDALAAGVLTKMEKAPMLLVQKRRIPKSISNRIEESKAKKFLLIGGEKTISDRVKDKVEGLLK